MIDTLKKELIHLPFVIVVTILLYAITVFADTIFQASEVDYDNTNSGIVSDRVQGAVDELYECMTTRNEYSSLVAVPEGIIGTGTLKTSDQTITGAINELNGKFTNGVLKKDNGGTGATSESTARSSLGMASTSDIPKYHNGQTETGNISGTIYGIDYRSISYGKVVSIRLQGQATTDISADTTIFTVPSGKRPPNTIFMVLFSNQNGSSTKDAIRVNITTNGNVVIKQGVNTNKTVFGTCTFIAT